MGYNDDWESLMNSVFGAGGRMHTSGDAARQAIEDSRQLLRQMESDGLLAKGAADAAETGKAGSFEGLAAEVKQSVLGQDDYVDALVRAMRRPFVLGADGQKARRYLYQRFSGMPLIFIRTFFFTVSSTSSYSSLPSSDFPVTRSRWAAALERTVSIRSTINSMSFSTSPREVIAGVPTLIPEVWKGDLESNGTIFLFTVMSARTSSFSATFPVRSGNFVRRSMSMRWLSVPPETTLYPLSENDSAMAEALATTCF